MRKVKAWLLMIGDEILGDGKWGLDIYPTKEDAEKTRKANGAEIEWDVVPCTISFNPNPRRKPARRKE